MPEKTIFVRLTIKDQMVRNEKGTSVVEFAIILPLLMLLIFAIIEFGLLWYNKAMVTNAAREGARVGLVFRVNNATDYYPLLEGEISAVVNSYLANHLVTFGGSTTVEPVINPCPTDYTLVDRRIQVTVPFTYTFLTIPNLTSLVVRGPSGFPISIDLTSQSVMRCE